MYEVSNNGPHELHAGTEPAKGGLAGYMQRRHSMRKSGGVERYG
jgi:hypothetical protein